MCGLLPSTLDGAALTDSSFPPMPSLGGNVESNSHFFFTHLHPGRGIHLTIFVSNDGQLSVKDKSLKSLYVCIGSKVLQRES